MKMDIIFVFVIFAIIITCECNENGNDNSNTGYLSVKIHALELELKSLQLEFTAIGLRYQQLDTKFGTTGYHLEESPSTLNFGEWTEWSECDVSCGDGNQKRYKFCTESQMSVEGGGCSGITVQSRKCNKKFCPGEWTEWSECDVSCGDGNQKRYKFCTESQMSVEGGVSVQSRKCNTNLCPVLSTPKDCTDVEGRSGVYSILPLGVEHPFDVYCDMDTDGGRWTVFQRRKDGSVDFHRNWTTYAKGFGSLDGEFWLGNLNIHKISKQGHYELRVDLSDWEGNNAYAQYSTFSLGDNSTAYNLTVDGYSGTAGDDLQFNNGQRFSTFDDDNDDWSIACAIWYKGAWWYTNCGFVKLNGKYNSDTYASDSYGIIWHSWKGSLYSLKTTEMKMRKLN